MNGKIPKADILQCSAATCLIIMVLFILILTYTTWSDNGLEVTECSCGSVIEHYVSSAKGCGFNSQGTHIQTKMYSLNKSLWIKASAKCIHVTAYYSFLSLCTWGWQDKHFLCKACWEVLSADAVHRDVILLVSHPCHLSISPKKPLQPPTTLLYPGHRAQAATSLRTPHICSCDATIDHLHCLMLCFVIFAFWYFEEEMMMDFKKTEKITQ